MDLHVQTCDFLCDKLCLSHSIYLGWNYPWKAQKFSAFPAEDYGPPDAVGVKHRSKIVIKLFAFWPLITTTLCLQWSYSVLLSLCICTQRIPVSASWLFSFISTSCRELEMFQCLLPTITSLTGLYLKRLYLWSLFPFCRHILRSFFIATIWERGKKKKHILITAIDLIL